MAYDRAVVLARAPRLSPFPRPWLFSGMAALALVLSAACGGGDQEPAATNTAVPAATSQAAGATPSPTTEPNKFDPGKGAALAKLSLPKPSDLGAGWAVTTQDDFKQEPLSATPGCASSVAAQKAFSTALETNPAGRANVSMARQAADAVIPAAATFQAYIYADARAASAPLTAYRVLYDGDAFLKCFEEMTLTPGATVKVTKGTPSVAAPTGGVAVAYDVAISLGSVTMAMRLETYAWSSSNALAGVTLSGGKDVITPALVTTAVTKMQAAMAAAR